MLTKKGRRCNVIIKKIINNFNFIFFWEQRNIIESEENSQYLENKMKIKCQFVSKRKEKME
jgi:hypothetical protein